MPDFVPSRFAPAFARAAQRWSVSATLLAAQAYRESGFNPFARSRAGALGIAQFMPATARQVGLRDPLDPDAAIDAQAHLMRDLLRRFGSVELALAAYNAGPATVASLPLRAADPRDAGIRRRDPGDAARRRRSRRDDRRRTRGQARPLSYSASLPLQPSGASAPVATGWVIRMWLPESSRNAASMP